MKSFEEALKDLEAKYYQELKNNLEDAAHLLGNLSQKIVPVWSGELRASLYYREEELPRGPSIIIGYSADHAMLIHEDLNRKPGYKPEFPEQQSKFLETPLRENAVLLVQMISKGSD